YRPVDRLPRMVAEAGAREGDHEQAENGDQHKHDQRHAPPQSPDARPRQHPGRIARPLVAYRIAPPVARSKKYSRSTSTPIATASPARPRTVPAKRARKAARRSAAAAS